MPSFTATVKFKKQINDPLYIPSFTTLSITGPLLQYSADERGTLELDRTTELPTEQQLANI